VLTSSGSGRDAAIRKRYAQQYCAPLYAAANQTTYAPRNGGQELDSLSFN